MDDKQEVLLQSLIEEGYLKTPLLIQAFRTIDRADFVLSEYIHEAYGNYPLPIGHGQTISQPLTVAFMLELLSPQPGEKILDIGAGSGWQSALLASLVGQQGKVVALERIPELCDLARRNIEKYEFIKKGIVTCYCHDATRDFPWGSYDKIIAAAMASGEIPGLWRAKLKVGGRIVAPVGGSIWLFIKKSKTEWEEKEYPGFSFVPLIAESKSNIKNFIPSKVEGQISKIQIKNETPWASPWSSGTFDKKLKFPLFFLLFTFLSLIFASMLANEIYLPHTHFPETQKIEISPGLGSRNIAEVLKRGGAIRSKWTFVIYVSLVGKASLLKPGVYVFSQESTIRSIAEMLIHGTQGEKTIVIPEGWTTLDIAEYLEKEEVVERDMFINLVSTEGSRIFQDQFTFLREKPKEAGLEGYLFPDTYRILKNAKTEDIIKKMLDNFERKIVQAFGGEANRQGKTLFEVLTMASLIEKEVAVDIDREIVSGILWKRAEANIPLQVDATITYLTRKKTTKVSREETQIDSPYNTYRYRGLPLGPITNPGVAAVRAALLPQQSPYLYYLSSTDGRTIFSKTLAEHNRAKAKFIEK